MDALEGLFRNYRESPDSEVLLRLLEGIRPRVYNTCAQILRRREDTEDAAQETLLKIIDGVSHVHDPSHFMRWVYRLAFTTALDLKRKCALRVARERCWVGEDGGRSEDEHAADVVHDAMARLDDDSRRLIIEYYFEKTPLRELAGRYRCSTVAVWKRIARAKEAMKTGVGAGAWAGAVDSVLDSMTPVSAPAGSLAPIIVTQAGLIAAKTAVSAALSLGGTAMATKATLVLIPILCLAIGVGGGLAIRSHADAERIRRLEERVALLDRKAEAARPEVLRTEMKEESVSRVSGPAPSSPSSPEARPASAEGSSLESNKIVPSVKARRRLQLEDADSFDELAQLWNFTEIERQLTRQALLDEAQWLNQILREVATEIGLPIPTDDSELVSVIDAVLNRELTKLSEIRKLQGLDQCEDVIYLEDILGPASPYITLIERVRAVRQQTIDRIAAGVSADHRDFVEEFLRPRGEFELGSSFLNLPANYKLRRLR
ncbi:MAG: sigma-70 family RNA polymerase sigma factor [Planctomycetes bacterium]|nr:sigma-70 family RNA polymerase sigma factor [Planctomycetota bacterium]